MTTARSAGEYGWTGGELDKVLEREAALAQAPAALQRPREVERGSDDRDRREYRDRDGYREGGYPGKKKGGWLGELFEFGD